MKQREMSQTMKWVAALSAVAIALAAWSFAEPAVAQEARTVHSAVESYATARQAELARTANLTSDAAGGHLARDRDRLPSASWMAEVADWRDLPIYACSMPGFSLQDEAASQPASPAEANGADSGAAGGGSADLAKKLQNPVADLITVPFQFNFEFGGGVDAPAARLPRPVGRLLPGPLSRLAVNALLRARQEDRGQALRYTLNLQPVVPIKLSEEWNLISRTILPITYQDEVLGTTERGGLGDIVQSLFFSPRAGDPFIWGVGPVFLLPTATDDVLGAERWGMGPTGVILKQSGPWTYGILANHIWSFARDDGRSEVNATFLNPFLAHTFPSATTLALSTEATYDWIDSQWTVPLQASASQLVKIGAQPVQFALGGRYWVEAPDSAPDWSIRFTMSLLFPK